MSRFVRAMLVVMFALLSVAFALFAGVDARNGDWLNAAMDLLFALYCGHSSRESAKLPDLERLS